MRYSEEPVLLNIRWCSAFVRQTLFDPSVVRRQGNSLGNLTSYKYLFCPELPRLCAGLYRRIIAWMGLNFAHCMCSSVISDPWLIEIFFFFLNTSISSLEIVKSNWKIRIDYSLFQNATDLIRPPKPSSILNSQTGEEEIKLCITATSCLTFFWVHHN